MLPVQWKLHFPTNCRTYEIFLVIHFVLWSFWLALGSPIINLGGAHCKYLKDEIVWPTLTQMDVESTVACGETIMRNETLEF